MGYACLNWELYSLFCNSPGGRVAKTGYRMLYPSLSRGIHQPLAFALSSILSNRLVECLLASYPSISQFAHRSSLLLASVGSPPFSPAAFPAKTQATLPVMCRHSAIRLHDYGRHDNQ